MKKIIAILFVLCLFPSIVKAKHLEFMGIPITGTIYDFKAKLLKKGLKDSGGIDYLGIMSFEGCFAGRQSEINVSFDPKTKKVSRCSVILKNCHKKDEAISDWRLFKELLLEKYSDMAIVEEGNGWQAGKLITHGNGDVPKYLLLTFYENPKIDRHISYGSISLDLEVLHEFDLESLVYVLSIEYKKNNKYSIEDVIEDL